MPIKPASERRLIGRKTAALDIPAKTNGTRALRYRRQGRRHGLCAAENSADAQRRAACARSTIPPPGSVKGYISSLALDDPSETVPGWVMVFASSYPAAIRAADLVKVDWTAGRRRKCLRAGHPRPWRSADRRPERRRAGRGRPRASTRRFKARVRRSSEPIRPAACCIASSSRSTRWPSRRTASSKSTPAINGKA